MVQLVFNFLTILSKKHFNYYFAIKNKYIIVIEIKLNHVEPKEERNDEKCQNKLHPKNFVP